MFPSIHRDNYLPEPAQLELFDLESSEITDQKVKAGSPNEIKSNDIQIRSPTENADQFERNNGLNIKGASALYEKSRALVKKFFQNQNNQTSPGNDL